MFDRVTVNSENDEVLAVGTLAWPDIVLGVLFPTCPLRATQDVQEAYRIFREHGEAPVVSVTSYEYPIQLALNIAADNRLDPVFPDDYALAANCCAATSTAICAAPRPTS